MSLLHRFIDRFTHSQTPEIHNPIASGDMFKQFENYTQLMHLQDSRQLLEVSPKNSKRRFQSMIVGIDFVGGTLSVDEFTPHVERPESMENELLTIRHQKNWNMLEITVRVREWLPDTHCYVIDLPEKAVYEPRRHHNRIVLNEASRMKGQVTPLYGQSWYAVVKDISLGGMRFTVNGDLRPHLHKDKVLPKCQIALSEYLSISCRAQVKAFSYNNKPSRHTVISVEFEGMDHKHLNDLKHFIQYVELAA